MRRSCLQTDKEMYILYKEIYNLTDEVYIYIYIYQNRIVLSNIFKCIFTLNVHFCIWCLKCLQQLKHLNSSLGWNFFLFNDS